MIMTKYTSRPRLKVRKNGELVDTTMGRIILGELLPSSVPFKEVNKVLSKKALAQLIDYTYRNAGTKETVILADRLKDIGYEYATKAGDLDLHQRHENPPEQGGLHRKG